MLKKISFGIVGIFFLLSTNAAFAIKKIGQTELTAMQKNLKNSNYLQVSFVQEAFSSLRGKTTKFSGKAFFTKPSKFRWVQESPSKDIFVFDGKDLFQYLPAENSAIMFTASALMAKRFNKLTGLILSTENLFDEYKLLEASHDEVQGIASAKLKPHKTIGLNVVDLEIDTKKNFIRRVKLEYSDGKIYDYKFSDPSFEEIKGDVFAFVPPKGVKVEVFK